MKKMFALTALSSAVVLAACTGDAAPTVEEAEATTEKNTEEVEDD
ncbi:hypothetical protein ACE1TF_13800 [Geomicrobium sp. JSM 1781026]